MKDRFFIDTNIFVYTFDDRDALKRRISEHLIADALKFRVGVISYQVIHEFVNIASKKFIDAFTSSELHLYIDRVLSPLCRVFPSVHIYHSAIDIKDRFQYSFYDSLIIAAAIESNCEILYTEDLQDEQSILGVKIKNPFRRHKG